MGKLLDEAATRSYRDAGFHSPLRVFSAGEALAIRKALEAVEAQRGPVFTENRARSGAAFQGSYRYKEPPAVQVARGRGPSPRDPRRGRGPHRPRHPVLDDALVRQRGALAAVRVLAPGQQLLGVETDDLVSVWLAVSGSTVESGCVRLLPGSHKTPSMDHVDTWAENNMLTRGQSIEGIDESLAVDLELAPGEVALFDYRLAHASHPNRSGDRRIGIGLRSLVVPPTARQVRHDWDSATLVRGEDRYGHFELEPAPVRDFDPAAVEMYRRSDEAQRGVYYKGATADGAAAGSAAGSAKFCRVRMRASGSNRSGTIRPEKKSAAVRVDRRAATPVTHLPAASRRCGALHGPADRPPPDDRRISPASGSRASPARVRAGPPLARSRVALVTTAGLHVRGDRVFAMASEEYRAIGARRQPATWS